MAKASLGRCCPICTGCSARTLIRLPWRDVSHNYLTWVHRLTKLKQFIVENGHCPSVPSASSLWYRQLHVCISEQPFNALTLILYILTPPNTQGQPVPISPPSLQPLPGPILLLLQHLLHRIMSFHPSHPFKRSIIPFTETQRSPPVTQKPCKYSP
jgi:hypothetical protein